MLRMPSRFHAVLNFQALIRSLPFAGRSPRVHLALLFALGQFLLYFSFPNTWFQIPVAAFFAFVPLLLILSRATFWVRILWAWAYFQLFFFLMFKMNPFENWQRFGSPSVVVAFVAFFILFPICYAAFLLLFHQIAARTRFAPLICGAVWAIFEYLLTIIPIGFPLSFGITQYQSPFFLSIARYFGIGGISLTLVALNVALFQLIFLRKNDYPTWKWTSLVVCCALIGASLLPWLPDSQTQPRTQTPPPMRTGPTLILVQPNLSWRDAFRSHSNAFFYQDQVKTLTDLLAQIPDVSGNTLVFPEWTLAHFDPTDPVLKARFLPLISQSSQVIIGSQRGSQPVTLHYFPQAHERTRAISKFNRVPFFESTALSPPPGQPLTLDKAGHILQIRLCFETLYPKALHYPIHSKAILGGLSFNTWLGNTNWPILHMSYFPIRAAESGVGGFFLNNNGPSIVVDSRGKIISQLPLGQSGWIRYHPLFDSRPTGVGALKFQLTPIPINRYYRGGRIYE